MAYFDDAEDMGAEELTDEERQLLGQASAGKFAGTAGGGLDALAKTGLVDAGLGLIPVVGPLVGALGIGKALGKAGAGKALGQFVGSGIEQDANKQLAMINKQQGQETKQKAEQLQAIQGLLGRWTPYQ